MKIDFACEQRFLLFNFFGTLLCVYSPFSGGGMNPSSGHHPPHVLDPNGQRMPSAFIPFCALATNLSTLGREVEGLSYPVCSGFRPTVVAGRRCYSLQAAHPGELVLLLDYNTERSVMKEESGHSQSWVPKKGPESSLDMRIVPERKQISAALYINTIAQFEGFGSGSYVLTSVKKMTGTQAYLNLPDSIKQCKKGKLEDCVLKEFQERARKNCSCVPWALSNITGFQVALTVETSMITQELPVCSPSGMACHESLERAPSSCLVSCEGIFSYVQFIATG